jgi:hypothetical protein
MADHVLIMGGWELAFVIGSSAGIWDWNTFAHTTLVGSTCFSQGLLLSTAHSFLEGV